MTVVVSMELLLRVNSRETYARSFALVLVQYTNHRNGTHSMVIADFNKRKKENENDDTSTGEGRVLVAL